jgi:hypothetical protein
VTFSFGFDDEKHKKKCCSHVRFMLSDIILTRWQRPVASSEALDLFHWAMHAVMYRCIAMAIKTATFLGGFVDCCLFACCPGGCWGNTEQVVAQWQLPGASSVALDLLHRAMPRSLLFNASAWPSKWPATEAHLFVIINFFIDHLCG